MNNAKLKECIELSSEILKNFELSELPINNIILKCLRLCRLLGDEDGVLLFTYEASGYPTLKNGKLSSDAWRIAELAGRRYYEKRKTGSEDDPKEYARTELLSVTEETISSQKIRLVSAKDPDVSLSSSNPHQMVIPPRGNTDERNGIVNSIIDRQTHMQRIIGNLYSYVLQIYNRLSYGNIVEDTFSISRDMVNEKLAELCPHALGKFVAVYDNMDSNNPEDWANAVHSCRRILKDLAGVLYPPVEEQIEVSGKKVKLGNEQYINRLIQYIASKEGSKTYKAIVGSDLRSIGERIDAIYGATNEGTHAEITKNEASRFIIHTYLLISDIIMLGTE